MAEPHVDIAAGGYLLAGGGTAGHLFPAIAVADAVRRRAADVPVLFVGSDRPQERALVVAAGFEHRGLALLPRCSAWRRPWSFGRALWHAYRKSSQLIAARRPRVVIGCGGLASVPTVMAARRAGVPVVLLEQNVLPGRATRWLARRADAVCVAFGESRQWLPAGANVVVTGNPVRADIASLAERSSAAPVEPMLLIQGGTLGSQAINTAMLDGIAADAGPWRSWRIVHQTGSDDLERVRQCYVRLGVTTRVEAFLSDIPALLAQATIVVCRAGATTLAELACAACPAVVVPWTGAADDHQTLNADWYAARQAVLAASDDAQRRSASDGRQTLWEAVVRLRDDAALRTQLAAACRTVARPQATEAVLAVIDTTASPRPAIPPLPAPRFQKSV